MDRRTFFKFTALLGSVPLLNRVVYSAPLKIGFGDIKKETPIAVVYHCDFPQEARFETMLTNIGNHLSVYDNDPFKIKIVVVAHGPGVKFFLKDLSGSPWENEPINLSEFERRERDLTLYGVEYYICNITLGRLKLNPEKLYDFTKIVPSGVGAIGELQAKGFGYIKVQ
ncbi:MAG: DsrE family protein [Hydrogenobacter sp.]|uniref:DsrE family protein n=1 Tax=Hydrogenobacter thermophilus TaxID=940 RepID=UPI0030F6B04E